eukprot:scaffold107192_cov61-Attheya_sp.AAC.1
MASGSMDENDNHDYIFGFGSIINTSTHAPWLAACHEEEKRHTINEGGATPVPTLKGAIVRLLPNAGYERGWNFRSNTGFTALGIVKQQHPSSTSSINGVLFQVPHTLMGGFDVREVGYDRVRIDPKDLELLSPENYNTSTIPNPNEIYQQFKDGWEKKSMWVYVPQEKMCAEADENHPLLQSYVDVVMQGCLEWGGEEMAQELVRSTTQWSRYFLNDTPSSRRPWLFRNQYETIDRILRQHSTQTHFADRRHPEEFASTYTLIKRMRGTWSVPRRNPNFTGRDLQIDQIHARLTSSTTGHNTGTVSTLEVSGMGGVGKSQLCTEYCYRYFSSYYGLVIWLHAENAETLVADYRQLMADMTDTDDNNDSQVIMKDRDTNEVVAQVKARLFRSKVPWLLVFDNLEDRSLLDKFVPHGASGSQTTTCGHHVLVTTRLVELCLAPQNTLVLDCFTVSESVELLRRSAGSHNMQGPENEAASHELANHLGQLPLALGMAATYMQRCDVMCHEYLTRYKASKSATRLLEAAGNLVDYPLGVAASLQVSLSAIRAENPVAWEVLRLLCWLGPDLITKALLRSLLNAKNESDSRAKELQRIRAAKRDIVQKVALIGGSIAALSLLGSNRNQVGTTTGVIAAITTSTTVALYMLPPTSFDNKKTNNIASMHTSSSMTFSGNAFEQTDQLWTIFKSFSILTVKEGKGSMHRLLAQALRASQEESDVRRNMEICIHAVQHMWSFKPERVDTWQESLTTLEHVKYLVGHVSEQRNISGLELEASILSKEAGVFSAMALNNFVEAQSSLEVALKILDSSSTQKRSRGVDQSNRKVRAEALHELGRVFRYQGSLEKSEDALRKALEIRNRLATEDYTMKHGVADTLHELGVLETKKHNLQAAVEFLQQALNLRRNSLDSGNGTRTAARRGEIEADCAATMHQLAAVYVASKPPSLDMAETMLKEALGLTMQIGQRAATLKQLARVTIRQGILDKADTYLAQALELYAELYGESMLHINVAAVLFQQGALAFQRDQLEQAWLHFSECLRIRRHVYAYARPMRGQDNPAHLEVSTVLHELGCVAFAQRRTTQACELYQSEKMILEQLYETSTQIQRLLQSRLTNLTWLRKCAKELDNDDMVQEIIAERAKLKRSAKEHESGNTSNPCPSETQALLREALHCRLVARQFALDGSKKSGNSDRIYLVTSLASLQQEIKEASSSSIKDAATHFHDTISTAIQNPETTYSAILEVCDDLRYVDSIVSFVALSVAQ